MLILLAVIALNVYLFTAVPKGFFPQQDTGQLKGGLRADQSISSKAMGDKLRQVVDIVRRDPAVADRRRLHRRLARRRRLHVRRPEAARPSAPSAATR